MGAVAAGMAAMFDSTDDATAGNRTLGEALLELVVLERADPGDDVTSRLVADPAGLDDEEMVHQLVLLYAGGISPPQNRRDSSSRRRTWGRIE